ncbi:hypothetical protein PR202_gb00766 [Eleusine coracana subsp. coracana]|uniref:Uncharacterized protein n=1 Tax=Eleusine coracana subsp. coracana TaxID=191504 RepID=A0AAV5DUI6_ELECO|nr:hypothetical protein PR202_gb00766 [Eleusine coracana subsp. coracana]
MSAESAVIGRRSGCMGMAMSTMTTLFCGEVSRTQMYFSDSMVTWVKVTNCGAMPRLVSCASKKETSVIWSGEIYPLCWLLRREGKEGSITVRASRMAMGAFAAAMATGGGEEIALEFGGGDGWWVLHFHSRPARARERSDLTRRRAACRW